MDFLAKNKRVTNRDADHVQKLLLYESLSFTSTTFIQYITALLIIIITYQVYFSAVTESCLIILIN